MIHRTARVLTGRTLPLIAVALALTACKKGGTLVELTTVDPGEVCPAGGVLLATGVDDDKDGALSAEEITSSETVCTGETPAAALIATVALGVGDADCPWGGSRTSVGLDDGEPGGTADDGVLQPEEVDATQVSCNGEPAYDVPPIDPPGGPVGTHTIDLSGANGTAGGGEGGDLAVRLDAGSLGGGVRLYDTGSVDASFTAPADPAYHLGANPVQFAANATIRAVGSESGLATDTVYTLLGDTIVYQWSGTAREQVTGISVASGVTVTVEPNLGPTASLYLPRDLHIAGTLQTTRDTSGRPWNLYTDVATLVVASTGAISLAGIPGGNGDGGDGGALEINARQGAFIAGNANTSGSGGTSGGDAGTQIWNAEVGVYMTGTAEAVGGMATTGSGGHGADVRFQSRYANVHVSADLDLSGGNGPVGGGDGGEGRFQVANVGAVRFDGTVTAPGGNATGCNNTCYAGDGGGVAFFVGGGDVRWSGDLDAPGGTANLLVRGDATAVGGSGGGITLLTYPGTAVTMGPAPTGDVLVSGTWTLHGGTGTIGGDGGFVRIESQTGNLPLYQQIALFGIATVNADGGDGPFGAGTGGRVALSTAEASGAGFPVGSGPGGPVVNYATLQARGGAHTLATGGSGGEIILLTESPYGLLSDWDVVINRGDFDLTGGPGRFGGQGGSVFLQGRSGVDHDGDVEADGGPGTGGYGGAGGRLTALCDHDLTFTGNVSASGAHDTASGASGGDGGEVTLAGRRVAQSGDIAARGGNGGATGGFGGRGGDVYLIGVTGGTTHTSTGIDVDSGTGQTPGDPGQIVIDGMDVTGDF